MYISKRKLGQVIEFEAVSNTLTHNLDNTTTLLKLHTQYKSQFDTNSSERKLVVGDFYGTGIEIWSGFGPVGITEKKL